MVNLNSLNPMPFITRTATETATIPGLESKAAHHATDLAALGHAVPKNLFTKAGAVMNTSVLAPEVVRSGLKQLGADVVKNTADDGAQALSYTVSNLGGEVVKQNAKNAAAYIGREVSKAPFGTAIVEGTKKMGGWAGQQIGKVLPHIGDDAANAVAGTATTVAKGATKIPIIGPAIQTAFEVPEIIEGFKQGRGLEAIGHSGTEVLGATAGMAIGQALIPIPVVGAVIGGMTGQFLADKFGDKVFGKNA